MRDHRVSRQILRKYVISGTPRSHLEKMLAILVESGAKYCAMWVCIGVQSVLSRVFVFNLQIAVIVYQLHNQNQERSNS